MLRSIVIASAVALGGCSTLTHETQLEEAVFASVRLADTVESAEFNRFGIKESRSLLDGGRIIGEHPTPATQVAYGVGEIAAHAGVTWLLQRYTNQWCVRVWEGVTITTDLATVGHNAALMARYHRAVN